VSLLVYLNAQGINYLTLLWTGLKCVSLCVNYLHSQGITFKVQHVVIGLCFSSSKKIILEFSCLLMCADFISWTRKMRPGYLLMLNNKFFLIIVVAVQKYIKLLLQPMELQCAQRREEGGGGERQRDRTGAPPPPRTHLTRPCFAFKSAACNF